MHLRRSDETVRCTGSVKAGASVSTDGSSKDRVDRESDHTRDLRKVIEVEISIPEEQEGDEVLRAIFASWVLLLHRYQRDSIDQFSWLNKGRDEVHGISAEGLYFPNLHTVADLLNAASNLQPKDVLLDLNKESSFALRDRANDESTSQLRSFSSILHVVLHDKQHPLKRLLNVSEAESDDIWSWTSPLPETWDTCMHEIIADKAQAQPNKTAVEAWDGSLTYQQVHQYSTELAQNLRLLDDSPDQIVPILFEKSRWTVVAVLAVMKAGACFALLDPAQPEGRLGSIIQQTRARLLVSSKLQSALAVRVADGATVIPISQSKFSKIFHPFAEQQPKTALPRVNPAALMYIQFTSGSTGLPKGCMLSHSNFTSGAMPRAYTVGYRETSRVLDFASYAFDVSVDSMLCTLACGGTLCTPSDERRMNDLSGAMRDMRVNWAGMTPSVVRTLDPDILPALKSLGVGGEGISASDAASWRAKTTVVNCYGPSECTVGATYCNTVGTKPYISMGKGTGCAVWVVDPADHNKLVPPGVVGELLIEGPIVGYGYLNNPEKTKEVFIENPSFLLAGSRNTPGRRGRMYKTGDLVRYDPDGNGEVIFVGRQDQQVKLRGQRIELAEIEFNMLKHLPSNTRVAAEVIKPGGTGEPTLIAFVAEPKDNDVQHLDGDVFAVFSESFQKALQNMTKQLSQDLPFYMVPSAYIPLWKMPLLVSWKTDRKRLREIGSSITRQDLRKFSAAVSSKTEPKSEMALQLEKLWAKVLGGDVDFSAGDNFFSMGGDSLRAMKLVAAARESGISLSVPNIMLNATLSAMASKAKLVDAKESTEVQAFSLIPSPWDLKTARSETAQLCDAEPDSVEDIYPCTPLQEGLMALSAKFIDAYVAQRVVELPNQSAERLIKAIELIVQNTPILRTRIANISGHGLFQVVLKDGQLLREHGTNLADYLKSDREEPMELGKALFRYGIVRNPESETAHVILTSHHAIYDGWSMPLILDSVNRAYKGLEIPRLVSFNHFIKYLNQLDPSTSQQYWKEQLDGASPHQFPSLPQKGYITRADSLWEHYVTVPASVHSKFTVATIIRGAWALVSSLYMGHTDIVFGETLTGRSAPVPGIEQIEGPMITTVPIRTKINSDEPISKYLDSVHTQTVQQMPHEHFGLQNIRRLSRHAREACELRTGLVLHPKEDNTPDATQNLEDAPANGFLPSDDAEAAKEALKFNTYALMLVCTLDENGFLIMASFDSKCISLHVMERVLKVLDRVVTAFLHSPESQLSSVATLEPQELEDAILFRPKDATLDEQPTVETNGHVVADVVEQPQALTPNQSKLQNLLSHILGVPEADISPSDSFFELGGDSISAMKLVSEARAQGLKLTVAQIFQSRSLAELAQSAGNAKEEKLVDILSRVLGMPRDDVGAQDSFFELGGDSISAMRLVAECRAEGLTVTVAQIFQSKSISELASISDESKKAELFSVDRLQPLLENSEWKIADAYPTRPLQKVAVDGTVQLPRYSLRYELIKFDGPIDQTKLAQSCQELVARNEVLRTVFVEFEGRSIGVVLETLRAPFETIPLPDATTEDTFIRSWINSDTELPKPYGSSFISFTLFTSPTSNPTLAFRISHAQYDEMCLPLVYAQLSALYADQPVPATAPFTNHVNNVPHGQSSFARRLHTRDVVFGEVVTGRNLGVEAADRIVGPTWQYAPFRVSFTPETTYRSLLQLVQDQHIASSTHEGMGLSEIVRECTDWDEREVNWFDSVVHQAPQYWVEKLAFGDGLGADFETVYPHAEPLREWKVQAFVLESGKKLGVEIVTFDAWRSVGEEVLGEIGQALEALVGGESGGEKVFGEQ
ncbi:Non-ribosomal peptide synthetase [Kalmusia sp. IMI 367209]|nr:Non-ribosomal peptide synthetase [Kalmusia sp. IMI 367209]